MTDIAENEPRVVPRYRISTSVLEGPYALAQSTGSLPDNSSSNIWAVEFLALLGERDTRPAKGPIATFLDNVYSYQARKAYRMGVRYIFTEMNKWLSATPKPRYDICDAVLAKANVEELGSDLSLSFLTITRAARGKLKNRKAYLEKARRRIAAVRGESVAQRLLQDMDD